MTISTRKRKSHRQSTSLKSAESHLINDHIEIFDEPRRMVWPPSWVSHIPFAFLLVKVLRPNLLVELGVHSGNSLNAFCQGLTASKVNCTCYGIDTFAGDSHSGAYEEKIYSDLSTYLSIYYEDRAHLLRMTFDEGLKYFSDSSIDLLHIDGLHTYKAVKNDFQKWLPKMSPRGVVLFHDTQVRRDSFGVWKFWKEIGKKYPSFEFTNGYGLGVLLVGKNCPQAMKDLINLLDAVPYFRTLLATIGKLYTERMYHGFELEKLHETEQKLKNIVKAKRKS